MTEQACALPGTPAEGEYIFRGRTSHSNNQGGGDSGKSKCSDTVLSRSIIPVIDYHVSCFPHFMQLHCCSFWNIEFVKLFVTLQQWERSFLKWRCIEPEPPSAPSCWTANEESRSSQSHCLSQCSGSSSLYWSWRTAWGTWLHCPPHFGTRNT